MLPALTHIHIEVDIIHDIVSDSLHIYCFVKQFFRIGRIDHGTP